MLLNLSQINALKITVEAHVTAWQVQKRPNTITPYEMSCLREELNKMAMDLGILHARFHFHHPTPFSLEVGCTIGSTIDGDLMIDVFK